MIDVAGVTEPASALPAPFGSRGAIVQHARIERETVAIIEFAHRSTGEVADQGFEMAEGSTLPVGQMHRAHPLLVPVGVLLVPVVALGDYLAGPEFGFSLFYLIPIVFVAKVGTRPSAWFTAVLAAFAWMVIDVLTGPPYSTVLAPMWNMFTRLAFFSLSLIAIRNYEGRVASAELQALSDALTGLRNRRYLQIMLTAARARLDRYNRPLTLAYLDVDDFKRLNDTYGHQVGDDFLRRIADVLLEFTRDTDTVARVGGDEFVVLLPEATPADARPVLDRIQRALEQLEGPHGAKISFSIGACTFYQPMESVEAMIHEADERMYRVKRAGKNAIVIEEVR